MKKIILEILLSLSLPAAIFHTNIANLFSAEKAISKKISVSIARDTNYTGNVYSMSKASVHVIIFKVKDHKQVVLWDKKYDTIPLKNYPTLGNALHNDVTVSNILDRKEKLYVTYIITYNTNGSIMHIENGTALLKGEKEGKLLINI